jgi:hypothetical protein
VYAAAAERAERERKNPVRTAADAAIASNPSVYDASQGGATMRR